MRSIYFFVAITLLSHCMLHSQTNQLVSFSQLLKSLKSGGNVTTVIYYGKCILISDNSSIEATDAIGGMTISPWEYFAPMTVRNPLSFVTSSKNVLISHPRYGYVYNYVKIKAFENDSVNIEVRYLNPTTFDVVMDERFTGKFNTGDSINGVYFYENK